MENNLKPTNGRKRTKHESLWERNVLKCSRNAGQEYISSYSHKIVPSRELKPNQICCKQNCMSMCSGTLQQRLNKKFWELQDYHKQNLLLSSMMRCKDPAGFGSVVRQRLIKWDYFFPTDEKYIPVCKTFLCNVLSLSRKRLETVQKKLVGNESFDDLRGKHKNRIIKLSEEMKILIRLHCESIPHEESHYTRESSSLKYFLNSGLNLSILHKQFLDYYEIMTGDLSVPLEKSTYCKFFNRNLNFTFKRPRTDVCNKCYESDLQQVESQEIIHHKEEVKEYHILRKRLLSEENVLRCEFDYAQNLPLPKIPVSDQFYKRLLWLYLFNVHVFGSGNSYMFSFLEGSAKKGANTVCSFLDYAIEHEYNKNSHKKVYLFSDASSGQNRNYTVFSYLLTLSIHLDTDIWHVFPVRGHSYCQADRNFGTYSQKKKKMERIETSIEYINLIRNARDPPFTMVESANKILHDFEKSFRKKVQHPKGMKISEAYVIHYLPTGKVETFNNYRLENPLSFTVEPKIKLAEIEKVPPPIVGITKAKMNDVKSLLRYVSPEGQEFFNRYFDSITNDKSVDDSIISSDEE